MEAEILRGPASVLQSLASSLSATFGYLPSIASRFEVAVERFKLALPSKKIPEKLKVLIEDRLDLAVRKFLTYQFQRFREQLPGVRGDIDTEFVNKFNKQLPDTITLIANALRAGSSFLQAIELVVRESAPPISTEFGRVIREVNLGLSFDVALENMVRRVRSEDLELMATAISIQHTVGGNLAEILDSIAYTIRERVRIQGEIRTLTAQQRLSGYVVGFLPIGAGRFPVHRRPRVHDADVRRSSLAHRAPLGVVILFLGGFGCSWASC